MFDLGFGEIALLAIVLLVVVGPRELPRLLRTIGRGISKLRNMSWELRSQSGIDEIIQDEDLQKDIEAVRSLSKGRIVDAIVSEAMRPPRRDPYRSADDEDEADVAPAAYSRPRDEDAAQPDGSDRGRTSSRKQRGETADDDEETEPIEVDRPARGRRMAGSDEVDEP